MLYEARAYFEVDLICLCTMSLLRLRARVFCDRSNLLNEKGEKTKKNHRSPKYLCFILARGSFTILNGYFVALSLRCTIYFYKSVYTIFLHVHRVRA